MKDFLEAVSKYPWEMFWLVVFAFIVVCYLRTLVVRIVCAITGNYPPPEGCKCELVDDREEDL